MVVVIFGLIELRAECIRKDWALGVFSGFFGAHWVSIDLKEAFLVGLMLIADVIEHRVFILALFFCQVVEVRVVGHLFERFSFILVFVIGASFILVAIGVTIFPQGLHY